MSTPPPPPHPSITPPGEPPPGDFQFHGQQPQPYPQPYQQPYQQPYPQAPYGYAGHDSKNWMNLVSMITGIVSCFGITAVLAIIFGHLGQAAARRGEATNRGMGVAGLILGYLGLAFSIAFWVFAFWLEIECTTNPDAYVCEDY